jgi:Arc/MetJ-type ribon-helix-helix transcriptional regulator
MKKGKLHDSRTALRLPHDQRQQIDKLVNEGKFESLSHVIRTALEQFLQNT